MGVIGASVLWALAVAGIGEPDPAQERLYGRVHVSSGEVVEGYLRWDRNASGWFDYLDGMKELPAEHLREAERLDPDYAEEQRLKRSIVAFGTRLTWDVDDETDPPTTPSAIRFGHLASLTPRDSRSAILRLVSGEEVIMHSGSSDLGRSMGDLVVEIPAESKRTFDWGDLESVEFMRAPEGTAPPVGARLGGTLTTRSGTTVEGPVAWDRDEIFPTDVLDGEQEGRDREIAFGDIRVIAWESDRSARVSLMSGEEFVLRGTNDVDRGNRGIEVVDPAFGRVVAYWSDFDSIRFHDVPTAAAPDLPDPGRRLTGTVRALDGRIIQGEIRWDNDEGFAWETLDGWADDMLYAIEFGAIRSVERADDDGVVVTLHDGRTLRLKDDPDVGEGNRGIFVKPEGRNVRLVRWRDFARADFTW